MRHYEFTSILVEAAAQPKPGKVDVIPQPITKAQVEQVLRANG